MPIDFTSKPKLALICKALAAVHILGGAFGLVTCLSHMHGKALGFMLLLSYLFLLGQVAVGMFGGWKLWKEEHAGLQILYWLSWMCVPVVITQVFTYFCGFGAVIPVYAHSSFGHMKLLTHFYFGFASQVAIAQKNFFSIFVGTGFGVNVFAIGLVVFIDRIMTQLGVRRLPRTLAERVVPALQPPLGM